MRFACIAVFLCAACGPVDPGPCDDDGRLEVGSGGSRLLALPEGGELPIVRGPQGGIHLIVGFWLRDLPLEVEARYWLEDDGERVGNETVLSLTPSLFGVDGTRYIRHPDLLVLNNETANAADFAGRTVTLYASATASGDAACDARSVLIVDPEAP